MRTSKVALSGLFLGLVMVILSAPVIAVTASTLPCPTVSCFMAG